MIKRRHFARIRTACMWSVIALLGLYTSASAQAGRNLQREKPGAIQTSRTALIIGNGAYADAPLRNPPHDAADMAAELRTLGFEVLSHTNLDQNGMKRAIRDFGAKLRAKGGVGLFYYAGHGVQVRGVNYLIPVGAKVNSEEEVEYESVEAGLVLSQMDSAKNSMNIVILDACRNNPFARSYRSADKGLASIDAPAGTLIAYSTAPGSVASDGSGRNGLYTQELLKQMKTSGMSIEDVFKQVRISVRAATAGKQTPWESSSLTGEFYFAGRGGDASRPATSAAANPQTQSSKVFRTVENSIGMKLLPIDAGEFLMGSADSKKTSPIRTVILKEFFLSQTEVTIGQWKKVMGELPAALAAADPRFRTSDNQPVVFVSWNDAKFFIERLNRLDQSFEYRLPTEAEWEYASRAGTTTLYSVGDVIHEDQANFDPTGGLKPGAATKDVGTYPLNPFGLYDMHGNVWEWVEDIYADSYSGLPTDGTANVTVGNKSLRIFRGGSWEDDVLALRSDLRRSGNQNFRDVHVGFRVAARRKTAAGSAARENARPQPESRVVQESMFTFELLRCVKSGSMVTCDLTITNNDKIDKKLEVPFPDTANGRTFDDQGNQSELESWRIGAAHAAREVLLIPHVPVKAYFRFKGVSPGATVLKRLDLGLETAFSEGGDYKRRPVVVRFENVPLQ